MEDQRQNGHHDRCAICDFVTSAAPASRVYEDAQWVAGILDGVEVPGWIVLGLRRHATDAWGMNPAEAATFGPLVARLSQAIQNATDAERVYLVAYGENAHHWHVMLTSRDASVPAEHRHAAMWSHRDAYVDTAGAVAAAERIRAALDAREADPPALAEDHA
jgi:diadenosine tetraphosphate (Ap4A) HIT family hydrolase